MTSLIGIYQAHPHLLALSGFMAGLVVAHLVIRQRRAEVDSALKSALEAKNEQTVLREERELIAATRKLRQSTSAESTTATSPEQDAIGLALSGGGIRAATFHLGVLQCLARLGILQRLDYLSCVSGGGYISGWLIAASLRNGFAQTCEMLSSAGRSAPAANAAHRDSFENLRNYAQYLTPRLELLGDDPWTLVATYIRNLIANIVVLASGLGVVFLTPILALCAVRFVRDIYSWWLAGAAICLGFIPAALAMRHVYIRGDADSKRAQSRLDEVRLLPWLGHGAIYVSSLVAAQVAANISGMDSKSFRRFAVARVNALDFAWPVLAGITAVAIVVAIQFRTVRIHTLSTPRPPGSQTKLRATIRHTISTIAFLAVESLTLVVITRWLGRTDILSSPADVKFFVLGPLLFIVGEFLALTASVAVLSNSMNEMSREWLAWFSGRALLAGFLGSCLSAISIYGPYLIFALDSTSRKLFVVFWVVWTIIGVEFWTRCPPPRRFAADLICRSAPWVFGLGFYLTICILTTAFLQNTDGEHYWRRLLAYNGHLVGATWSAAILATLLLSWRTGVNQFSMHWFYRNRLVRCYLRSSAYPTGLPDPCTDLQNGDDMPLTQFAKTDRYSGPYPLFCCALNLVAGDELAWQERKAASFLLSPLNCGYVPRCSTSRTEAHLWEDGFRPTQSYSFPGGMTLGHAMALSGAALSPSMGYLTTTPMSFLLTVLNLRLGWWLSNPRHKYSWNRIVSRNRLYTFLGNYSHGLMIEAQISMSPTADILKT